MKTIDTKRKYKGYFLIIKGMVLIAVGTILKFLACSIFSIIVIKPRNKLIWRRILYLILLHIVYFCYYHNAIIAGLMVSFVWQIIIYAEEEKLLRRFWSYLIITILSYGWLTVGWYILNWKYIIGSNDEYRLYTILGSGIVVLFAFYFKIIIAKIIDTLNKNPKFRNNPYIQFKSPYKGPY